MKKGNSVAKKTKRGRGRPRKRGRPKGSRNKIVKGLKEALNTVKSGKIADNAKTFIVTAATPHGLEIGDIVTFAHDVIPDVSTRLDKLMTEFETEMQRVMSKLKETF